MFPIKDDRLKNDVQFRNLVELAIRDPVGMNKRIRAAECKFDGGLLKFIRLMWPFVEPSRSFVEGWHLEARPQHGEGSIDHKKLEGLLRAKGLDPTHYMDTVITFKFNPDKVDTIRTKLSQAELDTCKMQMSYAVQRPKRINDNE